MPENVRWAPNNSVKFTAHNPTKHVFVISLPANEAPKTYEDEIVVVLKQGGLVVEELHLAPGVFRSLCNAFAAFHKNVEADIQHGGAVFTAEMGEQ